MALDLTATYKRSTHVAFRNLEDKFYIIPSTKAHDGEQIIYYILNDVAQEVWNRLDGHKPIHQIVDELLSVFDVDYDRLAMDIRELLSDMEHKRIVTKVPVSNA